MKIPEIPLPGPVFTIEVTRGSDRERRSAAAALRFLLWAVPSGAADYFLASAPGPHPLWASLAAAYLVLAVAVLIVNVRDGAEGGQS